MKYILGFLFFLFMNYLAMAQIIADEMFLLSKDDLWIKTNIVCFKENNLIFNQVAFHGSGILYRIAPSKQTYTNDNLFKKNNISIGIKRKVKIDFFDKFNSKNEQVVKLFDKNISDCQLTRFCFGLKFLKKCSITNRAIILKMNILNNSNNFLLVFQYAKNYQLCPLIQWDFLCFNNGNTQQIITFRSSIYMNISLQPIEKPPIA
jgi:hypothetical protein